MSCGKKQLERLEGRAQWTCPRCGNHNSIERNTMAEGYRELAHENLELAEAYSPLVLEALDRV